LHVAGAARRGRNVGVRELLVVRERVFPSLDHEILSHLALRPADPR
jgi:hypothetical protein